MSTTRAAAVETLKAAFAAGRLKAAASSRFPADDALNSRVAIWKGNITKLEIDAIVNAANRRLLGGGGVDGAIHSAAGHELYEECKTLNGCETGSAKITKGYKLPAKHVLHAVGPVYDSNEKEKVTAQLKGCYQTCLELATENKLKSVGFCGISTGIYGFPIRPATEIAMQTVRDYLLSEAGQELELVIFVIFQEKDIVVYNSLAPEFFPPSSASEANTDHENAAKAEAEPAVDESEESAESAVKPNESTVKIEETADEKSKPEADKEAEEPKPAMKRVKIDDA